MLLRSKPENEIGRAQLINEKLVVTRCFNNGPPSL